MIGEEEVRSLTGEVLEDVVREGVREGDNGGRQEEGALGEEPPDFEERVEGGAATRGVWRVGSYWRREGAK